MNPETVQLILSALLVVNLLVIGLGLSFALRKVGQLTDQVGDFLKKMQEEVAATLQETHTALERVETLAQSTDKLVREEIGPTLAVTRATLSHVEATTRAINEGAQGVRAIVGRVEAVSNPTNIAALTGQVLKSSGGKIGLLAAGLTAGFRALLSDGHKSNQQSISRRDSNGTTRQ